MISDLKSAYKENPKEFIGGIIFFVSSIGLTYLACVMHSIIFK